MSTSSALPARKFLSAHQQDRDSDRQEDHPTDFDSLLTGRVRHIAAQGDPEQSVYGKVRHRMEFGQTLPDVATIYGQSIDDLFLADPSLHGTAIGPGSIVTVLSHERLVMLQAARQLKYEITSIDQDLLILKEREFNRKLIAEIEDRRAERITSLTEFMRNSLLDSVRVNISDVDVAKSVIDSYLSDIITQGFGDDESVAILRTLRYEIGNLLDFLVSENPA